MAHSKFDRLLKSLWQCAYYMDLFNLSYFSRLWSFEKIVCETESSGIRESSWLITNLVWQLWQVKEKENANYNEEALPSLTTSVCDFIQLVMALLPWRCAERQLGCMWWAHGNMLSGGDKQKTAGRSVRCQSRLQGMCPRTDLPLACGRGTPQREYCSSQYSLTYCALPCHKRQRSALHSSSNCGLDSHIRT